MPSVGEIRIVAGERLGIFAGLLSKLLLRELFVACLFEIIVIAAGLPAIVGDLLDLFVHALGPAFPAGSAFAGGFVGLPSPCSALGRPSGRARVCSDV